MTRQYFNKNSNSYKLDPWTVDEIKYFDNIREIFETNETIKAFDSAKYEINIITMPSQGWFNYDGEVSTIDTEAFEFWQDLAFTYDIIDEHEKNIERGKYTEEEIVKYKEDKHYTFQVNADLEAMTKFGMSLPEYNKIVYVVDGKDDAGDKTKVTFDTIEDAKSYANKTNGKIYKANPYELYKATIKLKSFKDVLKELPKKESVLGKIADYKKETKEQPRLNKEKNKNLDI